jgi:hypothetical protein
MRYTHRPSRSVALLGLASALTAVALAQPSSAADPANVLVNAGGGAVTDSSGQQWAADRGFIGGWNYSTARRIDRASTPALYQTERTGMSGYDLPVSRPGTYRVTLAFAELYWDAAGKRVFDVSAEGAQIIRRLDVHASVGKYRALQRSVDVAVTDGTLNLRFQRVVDNPTVSAIAVQPITGSTAPSSAPSTAPTTPPTTKPSTAPTSAPAAPSPAASATPAPTTTQAPTSPAPTTTTAPPAPGTGTSAGPACTSTMAAGGNVNSFINGLAAGAVGCLPGGTYGGANAEMSKSGTSSSRITVRSVPGQTAKLAMRLSVTSSHVTFRDLLFDTDHKLGTSNVWVKSGATNVTFEHNEFADSGLSGTSAHDGQCLYSDAGSSDIRIVRNFFHDCGSMEQFHHGMYLNGTRYTITDNLVLRTKAWGIHLYPNLDDSLIAHNTVDGSGRAGIIIAESSTGNRVVNNIVSNNVQGGVDGYGVAGANTVASNLCWNNGSFCVESGNGFTGAGNTTGDPLYVNRAGGNFRVNTGSPAIGSAATGYPLGRDMDDVQRPQGGAPDRGAYER